MNCSVRPRLKPPLETNEIPHGTVDHGLLAFRRDYVRQGLVRPTSKGRVIHATKPVRRGIRDREAIGECTVGNLIVIVGVTPTADAAGGIGVPERAVPEIWCV